MSKSRTCQSFTVIVALLGAVWVTPIFGLERRINVWLVCGTFDHANGQDFEKDFIGEKAISPTEGMISANKSWLYFDDRLYCRNQDDYNDLYTFFTSARQGSPAEKTDGSIAYAHTYVWSATSREVQLRIGANDGYQVWVNGKRVESVDNLMRRAVRDEDYIDLPLNAGWNRLLLKIANGYGIWGFYAKLCDQHGAALTGLEYSVSPPQAPLAIETRQLPIGFVAQPYVWLQIAEAEAAPHTPSASPFRLTASGGKPPYQWSPIAGATLPPGLWLEGMEGEVLGTCAVPGTFLLAVRVTDAEGNSVDAKLTLTVAKRPTHWLEEGRIGGLIHGARGTWSHGDPKQQARMMAREGYSYGAIGVGWSIGKRDWPGYFRPGEPEGVTGLHSGAEAYVSAFHEKGIRFATYVGLPDSERRVFDGEDFTYWPRYLDFLHAHFQAVCLKYRPAAFYLDGISLPAYVQGSDPKSAQKGWDVDAMYSLVKTLTPDTLIIANSNRDDICGDTDVISFEGNNDAEAYWSRWPHGQSGRNPKYIPVASWRYPFSWAAWEGTDRMRFRKPNQPDYQEWDEWVRVVVSLLGEGFIADLDHTFGYGREAMHEKIGDWMHPRLESIVGTQPGPLDAAPWGYNLYKDAKIYLHLLKNARGKVGWTGDDALQVGPLPGKVRKVRLFPQGTQLSFRQDKATLVIEMDTVTRDPVDTIIEIELAEPVSTTTSNPTLSKSLYRDELRSKVN